MIFTFLGSQLLSNLHRIVIFMIFTVILFCGITNYYYHLLLLSIQIANQLTTLSQKINEEKLPFYEEELK